MSQTSRLLALAAALVICVFAGPARAADVCYRLPFNNPNLADGWGSTCCGRTSPHRGVDFPQPAGTPIPAVADGVVRLKAVSGCLGNVVVIQHADGMFSGYNHMQSASPLAVGASVSQSDIVGKVGRTGTCATGPHLHLTMSPSVTGYTSGVTVDPYKYIEAHKTCNQPPRGKLDQVDCSAILGWGQDLDEPTAAIDVHLYIGGPAGDPKAYGMAVHANLHRDDLCTALGSCNHAFSAHAPLSFFDGVSRDVYAYAIDSKGGANTAIGNKPLRCDKPPIPLLPGGVVRRLLKSPDVLAAWKLTTIDLATLSDATLDAIPNGPDLEPAPVLVTVKGEDPVYLHEYSTLRPVAGDAVMGAWKLDPKSTKEITPLERLSQLPGADWTATPFLAKGTSAAVYLVDAPPPLWAELVDDDVPARMAPGASADITLRFRNRGSLTWRASQVQVAVTPRDLHSAMCDPSWPSCTRMASIPGETATGAQVEVHMRWTAPSEEGTITTCFGLVTGAHWFSDPGANGPKDDELCRTIAITAAAAGSDFDGGTDSDAPADIQGGCSCRQSPMAPRVVPVLPGLLALALLVARRVSRSLRLTAQERNSSG